MAPLAVGAGEVQAAFSGVESSASPSMRTVAVSAESVTVTVAVTPARLSSESVAATVTS